jgi:hypothetical protein
MSSWSRGRAFLASAVGAAFLVPLAVVMPGASLAATLPAPSAALSHSPDASASRAGIRVAGESPGLVCVYVASKPVHQRNTGKKKRKFPYEIVAKGALVRCVPRDPAICRTEEELLQGVPLPNGGITWNVIARGAIDYRCPLRGAQSVTATLLCPGTSGYLYYWRSRTLLTIEDGGQTATGVVDGNRILSRC